MFVWKAAVGLRKKRKGRLLCFPSYCRGGCQVPLWEVLQYPNLCEQPLCNGNQSILTLAVLCCTKYLPASKCFQEGNWSLAQFLPAQQEDCSPQASLQAQQTLQHLSKIEHFATLILVICRLLPQKLLTPRSTPTTDWSYSCCNCFPQPCLYAHSVS